MKAGCEKHKEPLLGCICSIKQIDSFKTRAGLYVGPCCQNNALNHGGVESINKLQDSKMNVFHSSVEHLQNG